MNIVNILFLNKFHYGICEYSCRYNSNIYNSYFGKSNDINKNAGNPLCMIRLSVFKKLVYNTN